MGVELLKKVHAAVARSTLRSQKGKNTSEGALLEVEMFKKCMRLWREARFQVKIVKVPHVRTMFGT